MFLLVFMFHSEIFLTNFRFCKAARQRKHSTGYNGNNQSVHRNVVHLPVSHTYTAQLKALIHSLDLLECSVRQQKSKFPFVWKPLMCVYTHRIESGVEVAKPEE